MYLLPNRGLTAKKHPLFPRIFLHSADQSRAQTSFPALIPSRKNAEPKYFYFASARLFNPLSVIVAQRGKACQTISHMSSKKIGAAPLFVFGRLTLCVQKISTRCAGGGFFVHSNGMAGGIYDAEASSALFPLEKAASEKGTALARLAAQDRPFENGSDAQKTDDGLFGTQGLHGILFGRNRGRNQTGDERQTDADDDQNYAVDGIDRRDVRDLGHQRGDNQVDRDRQQH